ncbi:hypothetical protein CDL12_24272 [Handroanthus impetiginosus]|uniref:Uncharacterized protein n=1 Tax=Handroanthus impetiginosus TaxID=429701 RepID=A0A2G9GD31_9LAMI|nr:hypothetical protein CDL12_24272 [Handroanthus impetiginosus]
MVNLGNYNDENGFKLGYLNYVEERMQVFLPNLGLKAKPHIESRIKTLKKDFHIVFDMLNGLHTSDFEKKRSGSINNLSLMMEMVLKKQLYLLEVKLLKFSEVLSKAIGVDVEISKN